MPPPKFLCGYTAYFQPWAHADALHATRAAVEEGVVAGGGAALLRAQAAISLSGNMKMKIKI